MRVRIGQRVEVVADREALKAGTIGIVMIVNPDMALVQVYPAAAWIKVGALRACPTSRIPRCKDCGNQDCPEAVGVDIDSAMTRCPAAHS